MNCSNENEMKTNARIQVNPDELKANSFYHKYKIHQENVLFLLVLFCNRRIHDILEWQQDYNPYPNNLFRNLLAVFYCMYTSAKGLDHRKSDILHQLSKVLHIQDRRKIQIAKTVF